MICEDMPLFAYELKFTITENVTIDINVGYV